jgi:hypothetical protein
MNHVLTPETGLRGLDGRIVLVKSSRDHRNPQAAIRGTVVVREAIGATPEVSIEFDVPQMFMKTAHHRRLPLGQAQVTRLLESEHEGVFEYTTDEALD